VAYGVEGALLPGPTGPSPKIFVSHVTAQIPFLNPTGNVPGDSLPVEVLPDPGCAPGTPGGVREG